MWDWGVVYENAAKTRKWVCVLHDCVLGLGVGKKPNVSVCLGTRNYNTSSVTTRHLGDVHGITGRPGEQRKSNREQYAQLVERVGKDRAAAMHAGRVRVRRGLSLAKMWPERGWTQIEGGPYGFRSSAFDPIEGVFESVYIDRIVLLISCYANGWFDSACPYLLAGRPPAKQRRVLPQISMLHLYLYRPAVHTMRVPCRKRAHIDHAKNRPLVSNLYTYNLVPSRLLVLGQGHVDSGCRGRSSRRLVGAARLCVWDVAARLACGMWVDRMDRVQFRSIKALADGIIPYQHRSQCHNGHCRTSMAASTRARRPSSTYWAASRA